MPNVFLRLTSLVTNKKNRLGELNEAQALFCEWNATRLGISLEQSRCRFEHSFNLFRRGHEGSTYRKFCDTTYDVFSVFVTDSEAEVFEAYKFHQHLHFLRMLSYNFGEWPAKDAVSNYLLGLDKVVIVDFGCGLAQLSRSLAKQLIAKGKPVELALADIPTVRRDFLLWVGEKTGVPTTFLDCTKERPLPSLPPCNLCVATEVLEHLHEPLSALHVIHSALLPGGFLRTSIDDHGEGFMHVSTNLAPVRNELVRLGYEELVASTLYRKPI